MDILNDWIYAPLPWDGVDFDEIEKALGFKLFIWQKTFITRGQYRRTGQTTAEAIKRLLEKDKPLDLRRYRYQNARERFEMQELIKIYEKFKAVGVETCEVIMPERRQL